MHTTFTPVRLLFLQEQNRQKAAMALRAAVAAPSGHLDTNVGVPTTPAALLALTDFDASDDDDVDELLRVVPAVQENSSVSPLWHCGGGERSDGTKQIVVACDIAGAGFDDDVVIPTSSSVTVTSIAGQHGGGHRSNGTASAISAPEATALKTKRRCGTVCLAGTAVRRGYCASSISRW